MPHIDFWYDFGSTYSYFAVMRVAEEAEKRGVSLAWKPFLLGPVFAEQGLNTSPYRAFPVKGAYMWRDLERLAIKHDLPFRRPPEFPQNGLLAARVALVLDDKARPDFTRAVFGFEFGQGGVISEPGVVERVLDKLGLPAGELIAEAQTDDNKLKLRHQTQAAVDAGIFGAPTFVTEDGELFWGHDRMIDALDWAERQAT